MFYHDRLNDDYELHQRNHSYIKDELDILVSDAKVKRQGWQKNLMVHVGEALISIGKSMKENNDEIHTPTLTSLTRSRNETIFE